MPIIIEDKNKPSKGSDTSDTIDLTSAIASATEQEIQDTSDTIPTIPKPKDDSAWSPPAGTTYPWEQPEKPSYPTYSITDFTNKPEVQEAALGMMEYLDDKKYSNGKNAADDFIDYARYSDWNLGASMKRTVELALKDVDDKRSAKFLQNYSYLLNEFNSQNQDGSFAYAVERGDGSVVQWGAATGSEKTELIARWEEEEGLSDISFANAEFLEKHVTHQRQTKINTILQSERVQEQAEYTNARLQSYDDQLIVSAKHGSLGEKIHELMTIEVGNFKRDYPAVRTALKGR